MISLLSVAIFIIPICLNLINLKYLYDVKNEANCEKINSPYINVFFDFYIVELCLFIFAMILLGYLFHNYKKISNVFKRTHSRLFLIKLSKILGNLFSKNKKIIESFTLLVSGIMIKLLYDIGNEDKCKDVAKYIREYLFISQILGFILISYNLIFK